MLFLVATMAVAVAQAPASRTKPAADPSGGGEAAGSSRVLKPTSRDRFRDGSLAGGAVDPFGPGKPPVIISSIETGETKLESMLDFVKQKLREKGEVSPNYVFRDGAEEQVIPTLRLRNVSLKGLYGLLAEVAALWSWLTVLAQSSAADAGRKRGRLRRFLDRFSGERPEAPPRVDAGLDAAMARLPELTAKLLMMKYEDERSVREIAGRLDLSEKAVESRLTRARWSLRKELDREK